MRRRSKHEEEEEEEEYQYNCHDKGEEEGAAKEQTLT